MTEQIGEKQRRGRGRTKPFPVMAFEDALVLPRSIMEFGLKGEIQRLTLFNKLERSPTSSSSRALITNSAKYGLTSGSYAVPTLKVTENGLKAISAESSTAEMLLNLAVEQFDPFRELYKKLSNHRLPDMTVLGDELGSLGIDDGDCPQAAEIFAANIRFLGLVRETGGSEVVTSVSQADDQLPSPEPEEVSIIETESTQVDSGESSAATTAGSVLPASEPSVHIDVQIHIDATASLEQIDQIFASMARHLYGREG